MPKAKKRKRSILAPILALLLVLALAGTLLFSTFWMCIGFSSYCWKVQTAAQKQLAFQSSSSPLEAMTFLYQ